MPCSTSFHDFYFAHKKIIIKAIEELHYEEILSIQKNNDIYILSVNNKTHYQFTGKEGVWDNIHIYQNSFEKYCEGKREEKYTLGSFFREVKDQCRMTDDTLARYIEEGNQTIYSELKILENFKQRSIQEIVKGSFSEIDQLLPGHPKLIMNKGRIGWGSSELEKYAPEYQHQFKLRWLAVDKEIVEAGISDQVKYSDLLIEVLGKEFFQYINNDKYMLVPVHPWQWDRYIQIQFLEEIANNQIIDLGLKGDEFTPQVSIRTLSNKSNCSRYDIKQSVSILNTSCVRGIPGKYIKEGYKISEFVEGIIAKDDVLKERVEVLKEVAAIRVAQKDYEEIKDASYRYKELLGTVWRESVHSKLSPNERAIPTAALFYFSENDSFIEELIRLSHLSTEQWLSHYFEAVIIPLYHLQVEHGIGLVAHGQNTILVLENNAPKKLIIKDFHGDLRLSTQSKHRNNSVSEILDKLPPHYLIHDLITGHFITVLRYISKGLSLSGKIKEEKFYQILGRVVQKYIEGRRSLPEEINLLRKSFEKTLVNKVRYVAGYDETGSRLKPELGNELINPLNKYLEEVQ